MVRFIGATRIEEIKAFIYSNNFWDKEEEFLKIKRASENIEYAYDPG